MMTSDFVLRPSVEHHASFCSPTFRIQAAAATRIKDDHGIWSPVLRGDYSLLCDYITADPTCVNRITNVM
jgi:hypothetical protein